MNELLLIFGMTLVTFGVRYPVLAVVGRLELPERVLKGLQFVPVAVLTAIIVPAMLAPEGVPDLHYTNAYLIAGVISVGVAWYSRNLLLTIVLGMVVFLLWRVVLGS